MRLRTFTADTMPAALALVKAELGDDAIILSSQEQADGVHITAAVDPDSSSPIRGEVGRGASTERNHKRAPTPALPLMGREQISHVDVDQLRYDVQHCLRFHNVPELYISKMIALLGDATAASILSQSRMSIANESRHFLRLALEHICGQFFSFSPPAPASHRLMLVGTPGIGKTLAIAKLATSFTMANEKVAVITTDLNRAGGAAQLQSFTNILNVPLIVCADKKDFARDMKLVPRDTRILVDTPGCNPFLGDDIAALLPFAEEPGMDVMLAMPAGLDSEEAIDVAESFMPLPIRRLVVTRSDCTRRFGGVLAAAASHRLPFALASGSASVADSMSEMSAKTLVQFLLKPL